MSAERPFPTLSENPLSEGALTKDNMSDAAQKRIEEWKQAKKDRNITVVYSCGDARIEPVSVFDTHRVASVRSIAAANTPDPFNFLLGHPMVKNIVVLGHYSSFLLRTNGRALGCGGLGAKAEFEENPLLTPPRKGIGKYIEGQVKSSDVVKQTWESAQEIARHTDKPVLAGVVDQLTELVSPFAVIDEKGCATTAFDPGALDDPMRFYQDGAIPTLDYGQLYVDLQELVEGNEKRVDDLVETFPDFAKLQQVQNPKVIVLTTSVIPPALRYPATFSRPNTGFTLSLPKEKEYDDYQWIDLNEVQVAADQLEFPITESVKAEPGGSFFDTSVVLIETPSFNISRQIAQYLVQRPWMRDWFKKTAGKVFCAEIHEGQTEALFSYPTPAL